ncbi:hypothetical protein JXA63_02340 [Candidatus Woesebacteria bacterium]|nr:hypothetical protein [Candidatus Woesebacteria bacterium]
MPMVEMIINALKQRAKESRMSSHPHNFGCNGSGDIETIKVDRLDINDPRLSNIVGLVTRCTSCDHVRKTGTLAFEDKE